MWGASAKDSGGPAVLVEHVSKRFVLPHERVVTIKGAALRALRGRSGADRFTAVSDVSFTLEHGERLGIIGANGSGKSTLLSMIARIYPPTTGRIVTRGRVCGLLGLGAGFNMELTGRDNIFLNGALFGLGTREMAKRYPAIAEFSELGEFLLAPMRTYSSGMVSRLGFSVAVHVDPDILLLDEVLAVGDEHFRAKCLQRLDEVCAGGTTVVLVSHQLAEITRLCPRTIWMHKGEAVMDGPSEEVTQQYLLKCG